MKNLLGPVGDLYCFSNTFRMLVINYFETFTVMHVVPANAERDIRETDKLKWRFALLALKNWPATIVAD